MGFFNKRKKSKLAATVLPKSVTFLQSSCGNSLNTNLNSKHGANPASHIYKGSEYATRATETRAERDHVCFNKLYLGCKHFTTIPYFTVNSKTPKAN